MPPITTPRPDEPSLHPDAPLQPATARPAKLSREDEAKLALENTRVSPAVAWTMSVLFLLTIFSVPIIQQVDAHRRRVAPLPALAFHSGADEAEPPAARPDYQLASMVPFLDVVRPDPRRLRKAWHLVPTALELKTFETNLESQSTVEQWILPRAQSALLRLGAGNEQVYVGRDKWLMYKPDVEYLTERGFLDPARLVARSRTGGEASTPVQPNPVPAIVHFKEQLAARGITLVVMPVPPKTMLYPDKLTARYAAGSVLQNPSYRPFIETLRNQGVLVCDTSQRLLEETRRSPQFLRTDTHWTPEGMENAAGVVARFVRSNTHLPNRDTVSYSRHAVGVANDGDIAAMLKLPALHDVYPPQRVTMQQVTAPGDRPWKPRDTADVLLLGDSFTNIYSRDALGWGHGGGLAEQVSYHLGRPLDVIAINAGGAYASRERLRDDLVQGHDRLAGKRVVIWEFAMRDLTGGDWKMLDLPPNQNGRPGAPLSTTVASAAEVKAFRRTIARAANQVEHDSPKGFHNEVLPGDDGWMFYLPDVYYLATRGFLHGKRPPQIEALVDFKRQLADRGIQLMVMPVPPKTLIYPEKMGAGLIGRVPQNPAFSRFRRALEAQGISVFDPTETLLHRKTQTSVPLFLPADTHWSAAGMDCVAAKLSDVINSAGLLPARPPVPYTRRPRSVRNVTDLSMMLPRQPGNTQFIYTSTTAEEVAQPAGDVWKPRRDADVLLLGDSFTNIYSYGGAWGKAGGLAEQLSFYLQRPVDSIAIDGGGADMPREELQQDMQAGDDRLAGKKLVIVEFACRYLIGHPWKMLKLPAPEPGASATMTTPETTAPDSISLDNVTIRGKIVARATVPPPNTMPYKDLIMPVQLSEIQILDGAQKGQRLNRDAVVYVWAMRDQKLTLAADWRRGQSVTLHLTPWRQAEDQYGAYNRVSMEGDEWRKLETFWGESRP